MLEQAVTLFAGLPPIGQFAVLTVLSVVIAKAVQIFSLKIVRELVLKTNGELQNIIYDGIHKPVYVTILLTGIYLSSEYTRFLADTSFFLQQIILTVIALIWAWTLIKVGSEVLEFVKESEASRFNYEFAPIFENMWKACVVIVAGFGIVAGIWQVNLTPFLASAGILGIVGGLAARDTIANFFGGLALYFDNTYKLGDFVVLDSGDEGIVVDIGIRSTDLKTRDDMIITVPNSILNSSRVKNESSPDKTGRLEVNVGVSYDSDTDEVEEALLEVAENESSVLESPSPRVRFRSFGDNALEYKLYAWIPNPIEKVRARHKLNTAIHKKFRKEGIEIPFPQRTIHQGKNEAPEIVEEKDREDMRE